MTRGSGSLALAVRAAVCVALAASCVDEGRARPVETGAVTVDAGAGGAREACNFADDDGDGAVDEGFDWGAEPWSVAFETACAARVARAIALADGRVAVIGDVDAEGGARRAFVAVLSAEGAIDVGPRYGAAAAQGLRAVAIAEGDAGEIGVLLRSGGKTLACPHGGCVAEIARFDARTLDPRGSTPVTAPFALRGVGGLASTPAGWVTLGLDDDARTHAIWPRAGDGGVGVDRVLPGEPVFVKDSTGYFAGDLASGARLAWAFAMSPTFQVGFLVPAAGGEVAGANEVVRGEVHVPGAGALAWDGGDLVLGFDAVVASGPSPWLTRWGTKGKLVAGPVAAGEAGASLRAVVALEAGVATIAARAGGAIEIGRFSRALRAVEAPGGRLAIETPTDDLAVARGARGLVVMRGDASAGPGCVAGAHGVRVARVGCR